MKLTFLLVLFFLAVCYCGRDFYKILNVKKTATKNEIRKSYRAIAKLKHPDVNRDDPDADAKFRDLNDAYEALSDDEKRKIYDKYGEEGLKDHNRGGGHTNPFHQFFGFGQQQSDETPRGNDVIMDLWVTLEEMYNGDFVEVDRIKLVTKNAKGTRKCRCRMEMRTTQIGPGQFQMHQAEVCDECPNVEFQPERKTLELEIEQGVRDGQIYPFMGDGEPHIDGDYGDLKFRIRQYKHKLFHRRGDDLYVNVTLSLIESLVGYEIHLKHLDNHTVLLKSDQVTTPGTIVRKPNEGMPNHENSKVRGSLFVTFDVAYPTGKQLTDEERTAVRELFAQTEMPGPLLYNGLDQLIGLKSKTVTTGH